MRGRARRALGAGAARRRPWRHRGSRRRAAAAEGRRGVLRQGAFPQRSLSSGRARTAGLLIGLQARRQQQAVPDLPTRLSRAASRRSPAEAPLGRPRRRGAPEAARMRTRRSGTTWRRPRTAPRWGGVQPDWCTRGSLAWVAWARPVWGGPGAAAHTGRLRRWRGVPGAQAGCVSAQVYERSRTFNCAYLHR
jgi:hypothetical protein